MARAPPQKRAGTASARGEADPGGERRRPERPRSEPPNRSLNPPGCRNRLPSRELVCFRQPFCQRGHCDRRRVPRPHRPLDPRSQRNSGSSQPLHQLPLRTDRVEGLQEHCPQEPLRRDRRAPDRQCVRLRRTCDTGRWSSTQVSIGNPKLFDKIGTEWVVRFSKRDGERKHPPDS